MFSTSREIITWERLTERQQGRPTPRLGKHIPTFSDESSDSSESSFKTGDTNEQLSVVIAQAQLMNSCLEEQDKEIKTLRDKLTEEEQQHDTPPPPPPFNSETDLRFEKLERFIQSVPAP